LPGFTGDACCLSDTVTDLSRDRLRNIDQIQRHNHHLLAVRLHGHGSGPERLPNGNALAIEIGAEAAEVDTDAGGYIVLGKSDLHLFLTSPVYSSGFSIQ
jgi:hypothetical protein